MEREDPRLKEIWRQNKIPVVFRREKSKPILVKLPDSNDNYVWLRGERRYKPKWNDQYNSWETPVAWFDSIIKQALKRYNKSYVIQLHREQQKCARACWDAKGFHCECSCMGANHGTGHPGGGWYEVTETFAFEWGPKKYACRFLTSL
jgi:hypothetical protein